MSRQDATDLLMGEREGGVFLVRDSATIQVQLVNDVDGEWEDHNEDDDDDGAGVLGLVLIGEIV